MFKITKKSQSDPELNELEDIEPKSWIDLINPTKEELEYISNKTKVTKENLMSSLDEDERSRFDLDDNERLIIIRVPYEIKSESSLELKTIPIGIIITENHIITTCLFETNIMNDFYQDKIKNFYTSKKTRFLIQILSRTNYYFLKYLDKVETEIKRLEKKLMKSLKNEEVIGLFELQKMLIYFNSAIITNGYLLENIEKGKVVKLYKEDEELMEDIIVENRQCLEMAANFTTVLNNTLDAYASIVSNNLNDVMKFLASLTIILSVPMMISSIYGMNISLPFQESTFAFLFTILISIFITTIITIFFVKRNWL